MGEEAECEFARSAPVRGAPAGVRRLARRPDGRAAGPLPGSRRTWLRTADGVAVEAAYDPYAGPADSGDGANGDTAPGGPPPAPCAIVLAHGFSGSLDRPALRRAARLFTRYGAVVTFSFRGHGRSGGDSTVGDREVLDLSAAVRWARSLGHARVATVGFSMGGSVTVRHGALYRDTGAGRPESSGGDARHPAAHEGRTAAQPGTGAPGSAAASAVPSPGDEPDGSHADAVVAVSAPARWYYRGTAPMRRVHWAIQRPVGRLVSRYGLRTRIQPRDWDREPLSPVAAAPALAPTPLLVVHGDRDSYFPLDHPQSLAAAADADCTDLWIVPGFGHAENAADPALLHRIGDWITVRWQRPVGGPA